MADGDDTVRELTYDEDDAVDRRFFDDGILHEINRRLLHPRKLALGIDIGNGRAVLFDDDDDEGWTFNPVDVDKARAFEKRHPIAPSRVAVLGYSVQPTGDRGRAVIADDYCAQIAAELGIDLRICQRVVIDLKVGDLAMLYVEGMATLPPIELARGVVVPGFDEGGR